MKKWNMLDWVIVALYLALFKVYAVPQLVQQAFKIGALVFVFWYFYRNLPGKRFWNMTVPYSALVVLSTVLGWIFGHVGFMSMVHGVTYGACLLALYLLFSHGAEQGQTRHILVRLLQITGVYCVISAISIIILGGSDDGTSITYFFGNKFSTSYYFVLFAGLVYILYYKFIMESWLARGWFAALALVVVVICYKIYCTTAVLAGLVLVVAPLLGQKLRRLLMHPATVVTCVFLVAVFPLVVEPLLQNSLVQFVIQKVLGESLTLTGRLSIYRALADIIDGSILFGYGYGNRIVEQVVAFGNAQNGFLQLVIDYGVLGGVAFMAMLLRCIIFSGEKEKVWPAYVLMYVMIVASMVEITYNFIFFMAIFILRFAEQDDGSRGVLSRVLEDWTERSGREHTEEKPQ